MEGPILSPRQAWAALLAVIVLPFWVFNFETWLAARGLNEFLLRGPVMILGSDFALGFAVGALVWAFAPMLFNLLGFKGKQADIGVGLQQVACYLSEHSTWALTKGHREQHWPGLVAQELQSKLRLADDIRAEGVRHRRGEEQRERSRDKIDPGEWAQANLNIDALLSGPYNYDRITGTSGDTYAWVEIKRADVLALWPRASLAARILRRLQHGGPSSADQLRTRRARHTPSLEAPQKPRTETS